MSNTNDTAREQANTDFNSGNAPATTTGWNADTTAAYDAQYQQRQREQQDQNRQS